jgi:polysaccharide biosynthesis transport protein
MTLQQFLRILQARYKAVLLTFIATVSLAVGLSLWLPKQYTASAAVVVDVKSPDPVSGLMLQGMVAPSYMATQVDIIKSDRVAKNVVKLLDMTSSPAIQRQWQDATQEKGDLVDWLSNLLQKHLDVRPARDSNVIDISYTGTDPVFSATVANAFAQAYMDVNLELRVAPARQYAKFFEEQTKTARDRLESAQKALSAYQQANGITSTDERLDFETAKLNETSSQLTGLQGQTTDSQSKRGSEQADTVAEVMQSPVINGLKTEIARVQAKLNESNVNLGKNHPQTQSTEAELASLHNQLEAETRKVTRAIETTYQVGKQREAQLKAALAAQKTRVLSLNKQRDELNVLRRDIESAQRAFEQVSQRASQSNIESRANQTNIAVLNPAVAPALPSRPQVVLNILVSIFLGAGLGVALALILELSNRRVRSTEDLSLSLGLPILGSIAHTGART